MEVNDKAPADAGDTIQDSALNILRVTPLGGLGDIGKNMMVVEYDEDMVLIDAGSMFPVEETPGIRLMIPDLAYVLDNRERLRAVLLTHGHEDHIGALPFLLEFGIEVPIYGSDLTIGIVESKLTDRDYQLFESVRQLRTVDTETVLQLGAFEAEFFQVNHSFPSSLGISLNTPLGRVIHTGDFKFDENPILGRPIDVNRLETWGREGILLLMADSTNAEEDLATSSEIAIEDKLQELFEEAAGRIFFSTFASNTARVQQVLNLAERNGRQVGLVGSSMYRYTENAVKLRYVDLDWNNLLSDQDIDKGEPDKICVLITGSQGEELSALNRLSLDNHRFHQVRSDDTVIISATPIPGNEKNYYNMVNRLFRRGANVIYADLADIHVSGHGSLRENARMLDLLSPRFFLPVHGEYRHLELNRRAAVEHGMPEQDVLILEDGGCLEFGHWNRDFEPGDGDALLSRCLVREGEPVSAERIVVDGSVVSDDHGILNERRLLRDGGMLVCVVNYSARAWEMRGSPVLVSRGALYREEQRDFHNLARQAVAKRFAAMAGNPGTKASDIERDLVRVLRRICRDELGRNPFVVVKLAADNDVSDPI